jgi:hypothetical protein
MKVSYGGGIIRWGPGDGMMTLQNIIRWGMINSSEDKKPPNYSEALIHRPTTFVHLS